MIFIYKKMLKEDKRHIEILKHHLNNRFSSLIERIYFFGSRVTKDKKDADYDILIVTDKKVDWKLRDEIIDFIYDYEVENDIVFDIHIFSRVEFDEKDSLYPLIQSVKEHGVEI